MSSAAVDFDDVQGLVRFGYKRMTEACYVLLRIKDAAAARAWLRATPFASAIERIPPPSTAVQVAFTAEGLRALGVSEAVVGAFSAEFLAGMARDEARSRRLGDVGASAPSRWEWGSSDAAPHALVMFFAEPGLLDGLLRDSTERAWLEAFAELRRLDTSDLGGREPFGFTDGISQPELDWELQRDVGGDQAVYGNVAALGEFLLGYTNEYGKYTDRPLVDVDGESAELLPAPDVPQKKDVGRNGTYVVFRDLRQDVRAFWQYVSRQAEEATLSADALAAAFVGRMRSGEPLEPVSERAIAGIGPDVEQVRLNGFTFDGDPTGSRCPLGAHIRRANPRNADYPVPPTGILTRLSSTLGFGPGTEGFRNDLLSSVRFHRLMRRGREYGPGLSPTEALLPAPPGDPERGLRFIGLCASISRQFEFLQNAWIVSTKFDGMAGESDPLLGNREPIPGGPVTDEFTVPREGGVARRLTGMPRFVTVHGGAYFFLPSLRALRYFAGKGSV